MNKKETKKSSLPKPKATTKQPKQLKPTSTKKKEEEKKNTPQINTSSDGAIIDTSPPQTHKEPVAIISNITVLSEADLKRAKCVVLIQSQWRRLQAKKKLANLREQKKLVDEKLLKLEEEAYLQMIKLEQEREEKKFAKRLKEEAERKERERRRKQFLEFAYDGNLAQLEFLVSDLRKQLATDPKLDETQRARIVHTTLIECKDSNNNSALSEAAAGGSAQVVRFLVEKQADPNSRGAFGRTPLWRSAFAGHLNCVQILLENGADPRLYSVDGQRCVDAATQPNVIDLLTNWNLTLTDRMLQQIAKSRTQQVSEQMSNLQMRKKAAHNDYTIVSAQFEHCKNELYKCNCELQRLNDEYLLNVEMYGALIEKKEAERVELKLKYEDLRERVVKARINYKDLLAEFRRERKQIKGEKEEDDEDEDEDDDGEDKEFDENKV